jgi:5'-deoxynucleotidase YfbR-like HD superfamily hydrolase
MRIAPPPERGLAEQAVRPLADRLLDLGRLSLRLGTVDRITFHPDGVTPESDTDHTVMLGLVACAIADAYFPALDRGLVAQFAFVHDVVEAYAGDMPTLRALSARQKAQKRSRERAAWQRIRDELRTLPWLAEMIAKYEAQDTAEARFVRAVDKLVPKLAHILNTAATMRREGLRPEDVRARYDLQAVELLGYAGDFPLLLRLRAELVDRVVGLLEQPAG